MRSAKTSPWRNNCPNIFLTRKYPIIQFNWDVFRHYLTTRCLLAQAQCPVRFARCSTNRYRSRRQTLRKTKELVVRALRFANSGTFRYLPPAQPVVIRVLIAERILQELIQEKGNLEEMLKGKNDEIMMLKSRFNQKGGNAFSGEDLNSRLRALTITLVEKQSALDRITVDKNTLSIKYDQLQVRLNRFSEWRCVFLWIYG